MTDEERPEWLRRCDAVNVGDEPPTQEELAAQYLTLLFIAGPLGPLVLLYISCSKLYRWLRR